MIPWPKIIEALGYNVSTEEAQNLWCVLKRIEEHATMQGLDGRVAVLDAIDKIAGAIIAQGGSNDGNKPTGPML